MFAFFRSHYIGYLVFLAPLWLSADCTRSKGMAEATSTQATATDAKEETASTPEGVTGVNLVFKCNEPRYTDLEATIGCRAIDTNHPDQKVPSNLWDYLLDTPLGTGQSIAIDQTPDRSDTDVIFRLQAASSTELHHLARHFVAVNRHSGREHRVPAASGDLSILTNGDDSTPPADQTTTDTAPSEEPTEPNIQYFLADAGQSCTEMCAAENGTYATDSMQSLIETDGMCQSAFENLGLSPTAAETDPTECTDCGCFVQDDTFYITPAHDPDDAGENSRRLCLCERPAL